MPTLRDARRYFTRYAGQGNSFTERLNFVQERLLPLGNWKGTKDAIRFAVYVDSRGNNIITSPRDFETILAGAYEPCPTSTGTYPYGCTGQPLPIQNGWYEYALEGPGLGLGTDPRRGIIRLEGNYTTFADWSDSMLLRIKVEQDESPGIKIILRGRLDGKKVYSLDGAQWIEGVAVMVTNATLTTTQAFDEPPYQVIKPVTKGRISLYAVDSDAVETLVGFYDPAETDPVYSRWKVPVCPTSSEPSLNNLAPLSTAFLTVCKKAFKPAYDDNDQLLISNLGALRMGLDALQKEDASDEDRAEKLWAKAEKLLKDEEDNQIGAGAQGTVQMQDDYQMEGVGEQMGRWGYGYGGGYGYDWW